MAFLPISIEDYIKIHLENNPDENAESLRKGLEDALSAFQKGQKCSCGNDLWIIGSAALGFGCFTCLTGEAYPDGDFEIDKALENKKKDGRRHINDIPHDKIAGIFDDDGYEILPEFVKKPGLCLTCIYDDVDIPEEQVLCLLTRNDQKDEQEFTCYQYKKKQVY